MTALRDKVLALRKQLEDATIEWHQAMLDAVTLKVGDVVKVTSAVLKHTFNDEMEVVSTDRLPDKVDFAMVKAVTIQHDRVVIEYVQQVQSKKGEPMKFGSREFRVPYGATVEKVNG